MTAIRYATLADRRDSRGSAFGLVVLMCVWCPLLEVLADMLRLLIRLSLRVVGRTGSSGHGQQYVRDQSQTQNDPASFLSSAIQLGELKGRCYVIDGDTIVIQRTKIRLAGIDAPELDQPWGQKSKWTMVEICKGQVVTAKLTGEQSYDRLVATCYLPDGRDIGAELIKRGLALDGGHFSKGKYRHLEPEGARRRLMWSRFGP